MKRDAAFGTRPHADELPFLLEEATIDDLHEGIRDGRTTCVAVVQRYIDRARAFNGVASSLLTEDGAPVPATTGAIRAQAPLRFPTQTVKAATILPDLDKYSGPPLEYGRMEPTASDPQVYQQFGMIVGMPNAGQVNALSTLNIRGERSVICKGEFDRHPSLGPLPPGAPPVCEYFRHLPDASRRVTSQRSMIPSFCSVPTAPVTCRLHRKHRRRFPSLACRSRWSSAPSPARKMCC